MVLIKGERIELPKNGECYIDIRIYETGEIVIDGDQDKTAKAIELQEHGDLIDEDEFRLVIYREIRKHKEDEPITTILKEILWKMDNAPVIVEATE